MARTPKPRASDVAALLEQAAVAVDAGRWEDAARGLVAAWDTHRLGRIARALAAIDVRLPPPQPLDGKTVKAREHQWLELAKRGDDAGLRRILAAPWPAHPQPVVARLAALAGVASPRISNALLGLHRRNDYPSAAGRKLSRAIFHALIAHGDHAAIEEIERLEHTADERVRLGAGVLGRKRFAPPRLPAAAETALARIETALAGERADATPREQLLAAVYATPQDDAPRSVYADVLVAAGDPRGELIALQLARPPGAPPSKHERKLLDHAGRTWFDGLDLDGATEIVFERGFPCVAVIASGAELRAPAWATIEALVVGDGHVFRGSPRLRALRRLYNLGSHDLERIELPSCDLELVTLASSSFRIPGATSLAPRTLGLSLPVPTEDLLDELGALANAPIASRLEAVRIPHRIHKLPPVLARAKDLRLAVELGAWDRLGRPDGWTARATRTSLELDWWGAAEWADVMFDAIVPVFERLRAGVDTVESLAIRGAHPHAPKITDTIRRAVAKWRSLETITIFGA